MTQEQGSQQEVNSPLPQQRPRPEPVPEFLPTPLSPEELQKRAEQASLREAAVANSPLNSQAKYNRVI